MKRPLPIALSQLVLWYNASRFHDWPRLLAAIPPDTCLKSTTAFGRRFMTERMIDARHAAAEKFTRNLPGLEKISDKVVLRGIGLLEKREAGYMLSNAGIELAEKYRQDPDGDAWVVCLARLLLEREPRCRALMGAMSEPGARLIFPGQWFEPGYRKAVLETRAGHKWTPFQDAQEGGRSKPRGLRRILSEKAWWCLGNWRKHPLVEGHSDCRFVGQLKPHFSLYDIGFVLQGALEVFRHIGLIAYHAGECTLTREKAGDLFGPSLCNDFGWEVGLPRAVDLMELLAKVLPKLRSDTGFIVASALRDALLAHHITDPDRRIADLEQQGRLIIYAEDYGQSRHGDGLYQDPRKQLIKIRLLAQGANG